MNPYGVSQNNTQMKQAANAALLSLLNLTLLPLISFIGLLWIYKQTDKDTMARYHAVLGIKLNVVAALVLFLLSGLMIFLGGFHSPWTWVYVISYFTLVHTIFIIIAVWALVRAWSGEKVGSISI